MTWFPQTDIEHAMQHEIDTLRAENERLWHSAEEYKHWYEVTQAENERMRARDWDLDNDVLLRKNDGLEKEIEEVTNLNAELGIIEVDLRAENERLKSMLAELADYTALFVGGLSDMDGKSLAIVKKARAALQSKGE
jgi:hypothetical protein